MKGSNPVKKLPGRAKLPLVPCVAKVSSSTEKLINSLQRQIECQQKRFKALRTQASFQQLQLEWYRKQLDTPESKYICWVCDKNFNRLDHFHRHIRESQNDQHQVLADYINQTFCLRCDTSLQRPRDLVKHERAEHRIERLKDGIGL